MILRQCICILSGDLCAQWTQTNGPFTSEIRSLAASEHASSRGHGNKAYVDLRMTGAHGTAVNSGTGNSRPRNAWNSIYAEGIRYLRFRRMKGRVGRPHARVAKESVIFDGMRCYSAFCLQARFLRCSPFDGHRFAWRRLQSGFMRQSRLVLRRRSRFMKKIFAGTDSNAFSFPPMKASIWSAMETNGRPNMHIRALAHPKGTQFLPNRTDPG